jgi:SAM-dependent methyltransferase
MASQGVSAPGQAGVLYDAWHDVHGRADVDRRERAFYEWILRLAEPAPGDRLLDVACGSGGFLSIARERGVEAHGIDFSEVAIGLAQERLPGVELRVADAEALPFDDAAFEVVTCLGSLEHLARPERGAAEIARVLAPEGTAVVFLPNLFFIGHIWLGMRHGTQPSEGGQGFSESFRTSGGWTELLESSGLAVRRWRVWNKIHATTKVSPLTVRLWNAASWLVPRNAGYGFAFVCGKAG